MEITKQWKVAGASAAVAALGLGGILGAGADESSPSGGDGIRLQGSTSVTDAATPTPLDAPLDVADDQLASPDGESFDSPLQSPDDSPEGGDSVDTPGDSPGGESADSPAASPDDSVDGQDSVDSPDAAPALAPPPPPAPAPAADSYDSPDVASVDSPDGASVDSPS